MDDYLLISEQEKEIQNLSEIDEVLNNSKNCEILKAYGEKNEKGYLICDKQISLLEAQIRKQIIEKYVGVKYCSPKSEGFTQTQWDEATRFDYERSMSPDYLEKKLLEFYQGTPKFICIFRSGMTAISATFYTMTSVFRRRIDKKIMSYVTYFETKTLIDGFVTSCHFDNYYINSVNNLYSSIKNDDMDMLFLELMDVSLKEEPVNLNRLRDALVNRKIKKCLIVLIDSTLVDELVDRKEFMNCIPDYIIVIFMKSCVKLKQFGFEFFNMGCVELYSNSKTSFVDIKRCFNAFRAVTGTAIDYSNECIMLSSTFTHNAIEQYSNRVRKNTNKIFQIMNKCHRSDIKQIYYQKNAPFMLVELIQDNKDYYIEFINKVSNYMDEKNKEFIYGTSFGFRHTRMEIIEHGNSSHIIRISPGSFWTDSLNELVTYLKGDL